MVPQLQKRTASKARPLTTMMLCRCMICKVLWQPRHAAEIHKVYVQWVKGFAKPAGKPAGLWQCWLHLDRQAAHCAFAMGSSTHWTRERYGEVRGESAEGRQWEDVGLRRTNAPKMSQLLGETINSWGYTTIYGHTHTHMSVGNVPYW